MQYQQRMKCFAALTLFFPPKLHNGPSTKQIKRKKRKINGYLLISNICMLHQQLSLQSLRTRVK